MIPDESNPLPSVHPLFVLGLAAPVTLQVTLRATSTLSHTVAVSSTLKSPDDVSVGQDRVRVSQTLVRRLRGAHDASI